MAGTIAREHVDHEALQWFSKHLVVQDTLTQIMEQARRELGLPLVPTASLQRQQQTALRERIRALIDNDEDRDLINAHLVANVVVGGVVSAVDQHDAEVAAGVPNLADRR